MNTVFPSPQPPVKEGDLSSSRPGILKKKIKPCFYDRLHTKKNFLFYKA